MGGGGGGGTGIDPSGQGGNPSGLDQDSERYANCKTGADANKDVDCARKAVAYSLEQYWAKTLPEQGGTEFTPAQINTFSGGVNTGCGQATLAGRARSTARPTSRSTSTPRSSPTSWRASSAARAATSWSPTSSATSTATTSRTCSAPWARSAPSRAPTQRRGTPRAPGRLLRRHVDPRRHRTDGDGILIAELDRGRHPARRSTSAKTVGDDRIQQKSGRGSTPRAGPTARPSSGCAGSPPATSRAPSRPATRSPPASSERAGRPQAEQGLDLRRPAAASPGCTAPRRGGGTCRPARPPRRRPGPAPSRRG